MLVIIFSIFISQIRFFVERAVLGIKAAIQHDSCQIFNPVGRPRLLLFQLLIQPGQKSLFTEGLCSTGFCIQNGGSASPEQNFLSSFDTDKYQDTEQNYTDFMLHILLSSDYGPFLFYVLRFFFMYSRADLRGQ